MAARRFLLLMFFFSSLPGRTENLVPLPQKNGISAETMARRNLQAHLSLWYMSSFASAKFKSFGGVLDPSAQYESWNSWRTQAAFKVPALTDRLIEVLCPPPFVDTRFAAWEPAVEKLRFIMREIAKEFESSGQGEHLRDILKERIIDVDPRLASSDLLGPQPKWSYMSEQMGKYIVQLRQDLPQALNFLSQKNFAPPENPSIRKAIVDSLGSWSFLIDEPWFDVAGTCSHIVGGK